MDLNPKIFRSPNGLQALGSPIIAKGQGVFLKFKNRGAGKK